MKKAYLISLFSVLILWEIIARIIANPIVFPGLSDTFIALVALLSEGDLYVAILMTLVRTLIGVSISFLCAMILATLAYMMTFIKDLLFPIISIIKTIPNVAIIIIALLIFGRSGSVIIAIFLVAFPIFYTDILFAYEHIDDDIIKVTKTYEDDLYIKYKRVFIPLIKPAIKNSLVKTLSLSFKVTVMAELLVQIAHGLGRELYFYRINIDTPKVFALVLIMVIISGLFDLALKRIRTYEK